MTTEKEPEELFDAPPPESEASFEVPVDEPPAPNGEAECRDGLAEHEYVDERPEPPPVSDPPPLPRIADNSASRWIGKEVPSESEARNQAVKDKKWREAREKRLAYKEGPAHEEGPEVKGTPVGREDLKREGSPKFTAPISAQLTLDPGNPLPSARSFIDRNYTTDDHRTLVHHAGQFFGWSGAHYPVVEDAEIRAGIYSFLEKAFRKTEKKLVPFKPTTNKVNTVIDALKAASNLPTSTTAPAWLDGGSDLPAPAEIVSCRNGLLHLPTLELMSATPNFFGLNTVEFPYLTDAPEPTHWLKFLDQLWPEDPEAVRALQEIMGYALTPDTRQQKLFLLVGPKRSGKGTIGRIFAQLLGAANVCAPTLSSLSTNFGLAPLIGKQLAIISDARLGSRADQYAITERLLSISGEDGITVDRKFLPGWTGRLPTRFLILSNELPRLADASGALASRFIVLTLQRSFYGREDMGLTERLLGELPGIFNWAIAGWQQLQQRGHFQQPESSKDAIDELYDLGSPIGAFIRDCCDLGAGRSVECGVLFDRWKTWCGEQGRDRPGTLQTFGRDLRAAVPSLKTTRSRSWDGQRIRHYEGIK